MRDVTIKVGGVPYRLTSLSARQVQEFLDYAKRAMPDPVAEVLDTAKELPEGKLRDEFVTRHLDAAFERKRLRGTLTDPDLVGFQESLDGLKKAAALMFKRYHPELSEDEVFDLVVAMSEDDEAQKALADLRGESTRVPMSEEDAEKATFRRSRSERRKAGHR
jgi:hypothetical protein